MARRIWAIKPRRMYTVTFGGATFWRDFQTWRIAVRNTVDHQRRTTMWWDGVSIRYWWCDDRQIRGVANIDGITQSEFLAALSKWEPTLRYVEVEELAVEIAAIIGMAAPESRHHGYRVGPRVARRRPKLIASPVSAVVLQPLPILISTGVEVAIRA
jgi:hypothetical protein